MSCVRLDVHCRVAGLVYQSNCGYLNSPPIGLLPCCGQVYGVLLPLTKAPCRLHPGSQHLMLEGDGYFSSHWVTS